MQDLERERTKRRVSEARTPRSLAALWAANPIMAPKISPSFLVKNVNGQHEHFTTTFSISRFTVSQNKLQILLFICAESGLQSEKLCFIVTLPRNDRYRHVCLHWRDKFYLNRRHLEFYQKSHFATSDHRVANVCS